MPSAAQIRRAEAGPGTVTWTTTNLYMKGVTMDDAEIPPPSDDNTRRGLLASFSLEEVELLRVIVDTVIPEDAYPGGWRGGVAALLQDPVGAMDELVEPIRAAVRRLDTLARTVDGKPFFELSPARRLELVEREYLAGTRWPRLGPRARGSGWMGGARKRQRVH